MLIRTSGLGKFGDVGVAEASRIHTREKYAQKT